MTATEIETKKAHRRRLIDQAQQLTDRARADGRELTAAERHQFDALHDDADRIAADVQATERRRATSDADAGSPDLTYRGYTVLIEPGSAAEERRSPEYRKRFSAYLGGVQEIKAGLQTDIAENGGYMSPPEFSLDVVRAIDSTCWVRTLANVLPPTTAPSVKMVSRTAAMQQFTWGQELATPTPDTTLKTGGYTLTPHYQTGELQVVGSLVRQRAANADRFVRDEIALCAGATDENAFLTGDGVRKPVGLFAVNPSGGLGTDRDVTGNLALSHFINAKMTLREPYLRSPSLRWTCHRNLYRSIAGLTSTTGEPLWLVSLRAGEPDLLVGVPVELSEYAPAGTGANNTYASGDYPAVLGAFHQYDVLDSIDMAIQVDASIERRRGVVVYIVRRKVDGCPRQVEAFVRLKVS